MKDNAEERKLRIRRRVLIAAGIVAAAVAGLCAALALWIRPPEVPRPPEPVVPGDEPAVSTPGSSSPAQEWETEIPDVAQSGRKEGVYTFMVAGLDVASGATDTMLLLSYDINEKTVHGLNLPRDTIMNVKFNSKRLNTVYTIHKGSDRATQAEKGMAALGSAVSKLTGIVPDYYILLEWEAIGELVDALGGVEFQVPFDMDYDDPYQDPPLHIHQKAGLRTLSGDDAMQVIRWRKNNDGTNPQGDVGRLAIQQDFLKAVVKKCLQPAVILKIPALAEIFVKNVRTDLTIGNILALARSAIGMDPATGVIFQTAPLAADAWYNGAAMVTLNGNGILEIVNNGMNPYLRDIQYEDLELIYKKSDGSYGVTRGELADPDMGIVKVIEPEPEPEQPAAPEVPEQQNPEQVPPVDMDQPEMGEPIVIPPEGEEQLPGEPVQPQEPVPTEPEIPIEEAGESGREEEIEIMTQEGSEDPVIEQTEPPSPDQNEREEAY